MGITHRQRAALSVLSAGIASMESVTQLHMETYNEPTGVRKHHGEGSLGERWLASCLANDDKLYDDTRLRREVWDSLLEYLQSRCWLYDSPARSLRRCRLTAAEKLLIFCYICGQGASFRNARSRSGRSLETISRAFNQVLQALLKLYPEVVQPPPSDKIPSAIEDNPKRFPYFIDCIGALDGTHIFAYIGEEDIVRFRNHYGDVTQNVLAAVDFDLNFTYILAGWEGTAHDGRVLADALQKGFNVPEGKYYVADAGYSNCKEMLTPYKKVRYHLQEITTAGLLPKDMYELFNFRHSSLRIAVERTFGVFKRRWRVFDRPHEFSFMKQKQLVYALAAVHNYINQCYHIWEDFEELPPHSQEVFEARTAPSVEAFNELTVADDRAMDIRRNEIAEEMYKEYKKAAAVYSI